MSGWILVIATMFYDSGSKATVYQFHDFPTESKCITFKKWIEKRDAERIQRKDTTVECVPS